MNASNHQSTFALFFETGLACGLYIPGLDKALRLVSIRYVNGDTRQVNCAYCRGLCFPVAKHLFPYVSYARRPYSIEFIEFVLYCIVMYLCINIFSSPMIPSWTWWLPAMPFSLLIIVFDESRRFILRRHKMSAWIYRELYY